MTLIEIQQEEKAKILKGLQNAYANLIAFKKAKKSKLVILKDNKIVLVNP